MMAQLGPKPQYLIRPAGGTHEGLKQTITAAFDNVLLY